MAAGISERGQPLREGPAQMEPDGARVSRVGKARRAHHRCLRVGTTRRAFAHPTMF
jgi:hypothetical protein